MFSGKNVIVLDLEVAVSPDACIHCHRVKDEHWPNCEEGFEKIGWNRKRYLGISIGCYYDYDAGRLRWVDGRNLLNTVQEFVDRKPLMVSFNGIGFDFPLMRAILRQDENNTAICDEFKELAASSYDILAEIWRADSGNKFARGLNSLNAICECNGLGNKLMNGAQAPIEWQQENYAAVLDYVSDDVYKTKALFELICDRQGHLDRNGPSVQVRYPSPLMPQTLIGD